MSVRQIQAYQDDFEEVNLEAMTLDELVAEKHLVRDEVRQISTQLVDQSRRPPGTEDDSPEWNDYRDWRRRARWALVYRKREEDEIATLLVTRQEERRAANERRKSDAVMLAPESACHTPEEYRALAASAQQRRVALLATLNSEGAPETLVLRLYRVCRHLIGDGDGFPVEMDEDDASAVKEASIFLRSRFTSSGVSTFVDGRLADYAP